MKKQFFRLLARLNKLILPCLSKKRIDISKLKKWQMLLLGWRYFVTKNALD